MCRSGWAFYGFACLVHGGLLEMNLGTNQRAQPGEQPHRHHSMTNIKKGYDRTHWGKFRKIIKNLRSEGLLYIFPHKGDGEPHVCAILDDALIKKGIGIANIWRVAEGLIKFPKELEELLKML